MSWWDLFGQQLTNGLVLGSVYVLIAVGFTMCLGVLKMINMAQGHFLMLGAFITYQFYTGWFDDVAILSNYFVCMGFAIVFVGVIGAAVHFIGVRTVHGRGQIATILTTIALAFLIENIARLTWTGSDHGMQTVLSDNVRNPIGEVFITDQKMLAIGAAIVLILVLYLFLNRSRIGKALRATTQNQMGASLMGINPQAMFLLAFMLAAGFAAAAGGLLAPLYTIETNMGLSYLFKAMIIALIGGMGSVSGAVLGGMTLGLLEALVGGLWDPSWVNVIVFAIIILIMIVRPSGLLGGKAI